MTKIDLITGHLGSGKTTLLKKYLNYLLDKGERICILEFDYGAVNVDMMLLQEFNNKCDLEMVSGGCDYDCHLRRFKTKLIAMGMRHYDRVIIEPSGIFDPIELFDVLNEEPLDTWYDIGSVITVVDPKTIEELSNDDMFITQISYSGLVYLSKCENLSNAEIQNAKNSLKILLENHDINSSKYKIVTNTQIIENNGDLSVILNSSYNENGLKIHSKIDDKYRSIYLLDKKLAMSDINEISSKLFNDKSYGKVIRIKGFIKENDSWYEFNKTSFETAIKEIKDGQDVVIIIGENLNETKINGLFLKIYH